MRVIVSGSTGLIGSAVVRRLESAGHTVGRLVRRAAASPDEVTWDPAENVLDAGGFDAFAPEAVVHLAGEGIAAHRWSDRQKAAIRDSRVAGTRLVAEACASTPAPPRVLVSGSAIGWYGNRGDEILTEDSAPGEGFIPDVCRQWEAATKPAADRGVRVVHVRSGIVMARGGALSKQLPLFRFGLGGRLASGRQWLSWVALDDEVSAIEHAIATDALSGPINVTAPNPVTNRDFTRALAKAVHRPGVLAVPAFALRIALGREMANELLGSQRVRPARLESSGFRFAHPELAGALAAVLGQT